METEVKTVEITREALIEKMVEYRSDDWDWSDTEEALEHGRIGFREMPNAELEEIANEAYLMLDDGERYTITDPCPIKPTPEEINRELLEALKNRYQALPRSARPIWWKDDAAWLAYVTADELAMEAIQQAEGR